MLLEQRYADLLARQSELAGECARNSRDLYARYCSDIRELSTNARSRVIELGENLTQELRAAVAGDDLESRSSAAYRNYQNGYTKLEAEFVQAVQEGQRNLRRALDDLSASVRVRVLDDWIQYLTDLRHALVGETTAEGPERRS
jgi:hypothetical protein